VGRWNITRSSAPASGFASLSHGFGRKLPRLSRSLGLMDLDLATIKESPCCVSRLGRSGISRRGGGRAGRRAPPFLPSVP
jgi:hypothetical protein